MNRIPYGRQYISDEDLKVVAETLTSDFITQGPKVTEFEQHFARYCDVPYAIMVNNGTSALQLCAMALNIQPADKIITTPITFSASANGFKFRGAEILFCDIDPDTFLMDLNQLEIMLQAAPVGTYKAVVPVDFAGYPIHAERLRQLADQYRFYIVEDACHSPGGYFTTGKGEKEICGACHYADLTVFSFHPVKHIACGEGGAITTRNKDLFDKLTLHRSHGITKDPSLMHENHGGWYYEMLDLSYNFRITDFQAALGLSQLQRLEWSIEQRNKIAIQYNEAFASNPLIQTPFVKEDVRHAYHLYVIRIPDRKGLYDYLVSHNIFVQVHYIPVHLMPYYRQFGWKRGDFPIAENYYDHCLSLPMFPTLTEEEQNFVIDKVKEFVR